MVLHILIRKSRSATSQQRLRVVFEDGIEDSGWRDDFFSALFVVVDATPPRRTEGRFFNKTILRLLRTGINSEDTLAARFFCMHI